MRIGRTPDGNRRANSDSDGYARAGTKVLVDWTTMRNTRDSQWPHASSKSLCCPLRMRACNDLTWGCGTEDERLSDVRFSSYRDRKAGQNFAEWKSYAS